MPLDKNLLNWREKYKKRARCQVSFIFDTHIKAYTHTHTQKGIYTSCILR